MEFTYKTLTPLEVMARIVENGGPVELWACDVENQARHNEPCKVTGADLDPSRTWPIHTDRENYSFALERILEFGDCPSPYGWHNPEKMTPKMVYAQAKRFWGADVDPSTVRLLARDEIGRRASSLQIAGNGAMGRVGYALDYTYFTTEPYGELPEVEEYTFLDCTPYGFSGKDGKRIEIPEGWELVPEKELSDVYEKGEYQAYWSNLGFMTLEADPQGFSSTIRRNVKFRTIYAVIRRKLPTWRKGDLVEVVEDELGISGTVFLKAGARGIVLGSNWNDRRIHIQQTSPDPEGGGRWMTPDTNLRPWTPGYGYMPDGNQVPEPPETHELVEEGAEICRDAMYCNYQGVWKHSREEPDFNARAGHTIRAYARRKVQPLQLREGGFYRTRSGQLVGPLVRNTLVTSEDYPWRIVGAHTYTYEGLVYSWQNHEDDLVMELIGVIGFVR